MNHREYQAYWERRWHELGIPGKMDEITRRQAVSREETQQLRRLSSARKVGRVMAGTSKRLLDLEEAYKAVQCPAMVLVAGELFHVEKNRDVGLSTKNGGNHWVLRDNRRVAADIFTVKPTDDAGKVVPGMFVLVDCLASSGSADTRPVWAVLGENTDSSRPWAEPPAPDGVIVDPEEPVGDEHRYMGGGNDTGVCDVSDCGRPKLDSIHRVAEGRVKGHKPWLGEDGKGDCDLCFQAVGADIHKKVVDPPPPPPPPDPEEPPVDETYHEFAGSATARFCNECGQARAAVIHQKPVPVPQPTPGGAVDTKAIIAAIEKASAAEVAAIDKLRTDVLKSVAELVKVLPGLLGGLGGLFGKKSAKR